MREIQVSKALRRAKREQRAEDAALVRRWLCHHDGAPPVQSVSPDAEELAQAIETQAVKH